MGRGGDHRVRASNTGVRRSFRESHRELDEYWVGREEGRIGRIVLKTERSGRRDLDLPLI
jgi:hypothetical protein